MGGIKTILIFVAAISISIWIVALLPSGLPRPYQQRRLLKRTRKVLENAEQFVLLSLDPSASPPEAELSSEPAKTFHGWPVLGRAEISSPEERTEVLNALYKSIADADAFSEHYFKPRHGLRAIVGKEIVDLVICFECRYLQAFHGQVRVKHLNRTALPVFDRLLERSSLKSLAADGR